MPSSVRRVFLMSLLKLTMFIAHTDAYNKTQILHRDVSAGNILITEEGTGILIDWDLSKKMKDDPNAKPRRHSRTVGVSILPFTQLPTKCLLRERGNSSP